MLSSYLQQASQTPIALPALCETFETTSVDIHCSGAAQLAANPAIGGRVRGALGKQLELSASPGALAGTGCDWRAPCALDLLFVTHGHLTAGMEIPRPWALAILPRGDDLLVSLRLFGLAGNWAGEIADALVRALRQGLRRLTPRETGLRIIDRQIISQRGVAGVCPPGHSLMLETLTPLSLRHDRHTHADPGALVKSLGNRASGLARWHGVALALDSAALVAEAEALRKQALWEQSSRAGPWLGRSSRHPDTKKLDGISGRLLLPPPGPVARALLEIGTLVQAGGRTTHGMGRYALSVLPGC